VIKALDDPRTMAAAAGAVDRLGDLIIPAWSTLLDVAGSAASPRAMRLIRASATRTPARDMFLARHLEDRVRELGLIIMEQLAGPEPASDAVAAALDRALDLDARHVARISAVVASIPSTGPDARESDIPVRRALEDELDLVRRRVLAGRLARHGSGRLGPAIVELGNTGPGAASTNALAWEALDVLLDSRESTMVRAALLSDPASAAALDRSLGAADDTPFDIVHWLRELVEDPDDQWRSSWLTACALYAARERGVLPAMDVTRARAVGDPVIAEELERSAVE
jgi:hypothetical protein